MRHLNKLLLAVSFITAVASPADWPMFRGNELRNGYYPDPAGYPKKDFVWVKSFANPIISSPSVVDKTLYIGTRDSCIYAINTSTGQILWKKKTGGWVDSSPLIHNGRVIVGSSDGSIYLLDSRTGDIQSLLAAGHQVSSPAVLPDGTIISGIGYPHRRFSAYNPFNSKWDTTYASWSVNFLQLSYSTPSFYDNIIAIGAGDGKLYGISTTDRIALWSMQTQGGVNLSTPAIDDTTVYFAPGNFDKNIYAVDLMDGMLFWKSSGNPQKNLEKTRTGKTIHPMQFFQLLKLSPAHRDIVIGRLGDQGITVPPILEASRSPASSSDFYPYGDMKTSSVAIDKNNVYVVQKELGYPKPRFTLLALDKYSGKEAWRFSELRNCVKQGYCSSPIVTGHIIYFGWGEGKVYAFETKTGKKMWEDSLCGDIISSPAIAEAHLYFATMNGKLYCYSLDKTAAGESFKKSTYCYPNPARSGVSNIQIYVEKKATMEITVYNVAEKPVFRVNKTLAANEKYTHAWNLKNVANGVYFAVIRVIYVDNKEDKKILKIAVLH